MKNISAISKKFPYVTQIRLRGLFFFIFIYYYNWRYFVIFVVFRNFLLYILKFWFPIQNLG